MTDIESQKAKLQLLIFEQLNTTFDPDSIPQTKRALMKLKINCEGTDKELEHYKTIYPFMDLILQHRQLSKQEVSIMNMNNNTMNYGEDNALKAIAAGIYEASGGKEFNLFSNKEVDAAFRRTFDIDLDCEHHPEYLANFARFDSTIGNFARAICIYRERANRANQTQNVANRAWKLFHEKYGI